MMSQRLFISLSGLCIVALSCSSPSMAQVANSLVAQSEANRFGLERMWFTRVHFDAARGNVTHLKQHVNSKYGYSVYEITSAQGRRVISEQDLDRFGVPLGKEQAEKRANQLVQRLTLAGQKPEMKVQVIPRITLYAASDTGVVQAIDAETGRTRWSQMVGNPRYPVETPGANDDYAVAINGSDIYGLDHNTGRILWRRRAMGAPGAGAAVSDAYAFVPMLSGTIESYDLEDPRQPPWVFQGHGRSVVQPSVIGNVVAWPTDSGHLNVADANRQGIRYRLETNKTITAAPIGLPPDRILVVATDGYAYCIREDNGSLIWSFSAGEAITAPAVATDDAVYIVTEDNELFSLHPITGLEKWPTPVPHVRKVVTATKERVYGFGDSGRLLILDAATGSHIGSLSTETFDVHLVNNQTDRIFLGSSRGVLQCLREVQAEWPVIRAGGLEEKPARERPPTQRQEEATEPAAAEPTTDPFGTPAGTDPFGTPSTSDPFGTPSGDADPFGTPSAPSAPSGGDPFADPFGSGGADPFK